jgi:uncharacterized protein (TIGR03435 family)
MSAAWQVREEAVVRGPAWLDSERFDVVANRPPDTTAKNIQLMIRSLLIDACLTAQRGMKTGRG